MTIDFSLDKKKAILLAVACIVLLALTFFAGLFLGAMMQQPETVTAAPNYEKPEKASAGAPAVLAKKLPVKPKVKLPRKPKVKLPKIAKKLAPAAPAAASKTPAAAPATSAAASATPPPTPPAARPKPIEPYPYSIRLASYKNKETALKALARHQNAGLSPYFARVKLGRKGVWWRLFTGYYPDREAAKAAVAEQNLEGSQIIRTPYTNLIGTFSGEAEMDDLFKRLDAKGYSPYAIKDADDHFRLITGAFITKKGAQDQHRDLKADGIDSKIVER